MIFPIGENFSAPDANTDAIAWGGPNPEVYPFIDSVNYIWVDEHGDTNVQYYGHNLYSSQNTEKAANIVTWNKYLSALEQYLQTPDNGGSKYFRTIQAPYSSLIEFEEKGNYFKRLHYAHETDKILDLCEEYDALFQFNLLLHSPIMKYGNYDMWTWDWDHYMRGGTLPNHDSLQWMYDYPVYCYNDNPSYRENGVVYEGSKKPYEMFMDENDLAYHKQRTRYYIARYGYSTKIYSFEILSEPWHLNEIWNVGQSNQGKDAPFLSPSDPEHTQVRNAVENYHKVISEYMRDSLNINQLVSMDMAAGLNDPKYGGYDASIILPTIEMIGFNPYYTSPNALISSNDNNIAHYVQMINFSRGLNGINYVPVIIPEGGTEPDYDKCSNYTQHVVDKMTLPFTGIAGYNAWGGDAPVYQTSASSPVTLPSYIHDKWEATLRVKNHINGNDVINTLSNGWGDWKHGKEKTHIKFPDGLFQNDKPELLEQQHYVSSDKSKFTGYVRNRTYNARTRGCSNLTFSFPNPDHTPYFYLPYSIPWVSQPLLNRLKVNNLQQGEDYRIHWYSFKTGNYIKTDCLKATNGKIRLEFPILTASYSGTYDNPVVWFVAERSNCNQNKSLIYEDSIPIRKDIHSLNQVNSIYPNPFDDYFIVNSLENDVFILQSIKGTKIGKYNISKGANKVDVDLPIGVYIGKLLNQSQTFKIIRQ